MPGIRQLRILKIGEKLVQQADTDEKRDSTQQVAPYLSVQRIEKSKQDFQQYFLEFKGFHTFTLSQSSSVGVTG